MNQKYDVLITGGGVVGLTAALTMAKCGLRVALIDAGPLKTTTKTVDSRVYAINKSSQKLLTEVSVWPHLESKRVSPYKHMHVWDALSNEAIDFDSRMIAQANLGFIIEESILKQALIAQVSQSPVIELFPQSTIIEIKQLTDAILISSESKSWEGTLLIVAEGADSPTRNKLGVKLTGWSYEQKAIVATVHTQLSHQKTAYQVFHPQGPLAFLPLADSNQCSIVWSADSLHSDTLLNLEEQAFNKALTTAFVSKLGAVKILSPRHQFALHMRHAHQYVGANWMLMGDAAHTIHPLAGLGLNIGLADVSLWYEQMKKDKSVLNSSRALACYQRQRKSAVWQTILLMEGFKRLFAVSAPPVSLLRGLGLRVCNQLTPLKRLFIEHAAGG